MSRRAPLRMRVFDGESTPLVCGFCMLSACFLQKTADELDSCRMIAESITSLGKGRLVDRTVREGRRGPAWRIHRFSHRTACAVTLQTAMPHML